MDGITKKLFVVTVHNEKRDGYYERILRDETASKALAQVATVRVATADDVERILTKD